MDINLANIDSNINDKHEKQKINANILSYGGLSNGQINDTNNQQT